MLTASGVLPPAWLKQMLCLTFHMFGRAQGQSSHEVLPEDKNNIWLALFSVAWKTHCAITLHDITKGRIFFTQSDVASLNEFTDRFCSKKKKKSDGQILPSDL